MKKRKQAGQDALDEYYAAMPRDDGFTEDLGQMKAGDFAEIRRVPYAVRTRRRKSFLSGFISFVFILFCMGVFAYCSVQIVQILLQYGEAEDLYDDYSSQYKDVLAADDPVSVYSLSKGSFSDSLKNYSEVAEKGADIYDPSAISEKKSGSAKFQQSLVFLSNLKLSNPDTFGYISIDGTSISYPMVKGSDNDFYLTHGFTGDALKAGAIYVDYRNSSTLTANRNTVVYGHNMENGSMFHQLVNYKNEEFFNSKQIVITTFDGIYTFEVFSFYETLASENYFRTFFYSDEDFVSFCISEEAKSMYHKKGLSFDADSIIITFSTCISGVTDGRYCLHAVLVSVEN